ncbi:hypothetical protein T4B_10259 [Trichinella pseudospiralis]|uniref:Uncharacterized protein n=1 Tax=Trichinella pseudospiralis TaxID=6337 RepID=A0A0V1IEU5_TRIPS|nr:hypothetical protein T4A_4848 [Trichinella pseudospiralis]KRZ20677.1 hypothetical protein T4B_10259 [Trichinella pseudospiralis]
MTGLQAFIADTLFPQQAGSGLVVSVQESLAASRIVVAFTERANAFAAADDLTLSRSLPLRRLESFWVAPLLFPRPDSSKPRSPVGNSESACSWANSRKFCRLSSDSGPVPTFRSQAPMQRAREFFLQPRFASGFAHREFADVGILPHCCKTSEVLGELVYQGLDALSYHLAACRCLP